MKCKACSSELITGTKKCPYCGALNNIVVTKSNDAFDWSKSDFHRQSKKKKNVSIDWNAGKIFDNESGQVYDQDERVWLEPEDVKDLFKFDRKNEEYQAVLDRQMDSINESATQRKQVRSMKIPSPMDSVMFAALINGDADAAGSPEISKKEVGLENKDRGESSVSEESIKTPEKFHIFNGFTSENEPEEELPVARTVNAEVTETDDGNVIFSFDISDLSEDRDKLPEETETSTVDVEKEIKEDISFSVAPEQKKDKNEEKVLNSVAATAEQVEKTAGTYTKEDEYRVFSGLKKLMEAEEKFKTDMERVSYLTPEETAKAAKLEEKTSKLTFVPTVSFRTIEDEYAAYCDENGIKPVRAEVKSVSDKNESLTAEKSKKADVDTKIIGEQPHKVTAASLKERLKRADLNKDKEVEIKINELSGTKVTVKTQEVRLAAANADLDRAQTREVNMDEVMNAPKNLQVSVEVNAAQGNASVEVTRRHDGATVVKTVDKSNPEHLYADENKDSESVSVSDSSKLKNKDKKNSFWERSEDVSRMTITDIFGPEARKIINQIDKAYNEDDAAEKDIENSLILDINPEDIAMTADQTAALHGISFEDDEDIDDENNDSDYAASDVSDAENSAVNDDYKTAEAGKSVITEKTLEVSAQAAVENTAEEASESESLEEQGSGEGEEYSADASDDAETEEISGNTADSNKPEGNKAAEPSESPINIQEETHIFDDESNINNKNISENVTANAASAPADNEIAEKAETVSDSKADEKVERAVGAPASEPAVKAVPEGGVHISQDESSTDDGPHLEKTKPLLKAEQAMLKEAARQKKRAEKAQKQLLKENEEESGGFSKLLKVFIAILVIILIAEFSFIGIKLYLPDTRAAVFVERVEENIFGLVDKIKGGSGGEDSGNSDGQVSQDQPDAQNSGTGVGEGGTEQGSETSGNGE